MAESKSSSSNFAEILKRFENATQKLEDAALSKSSSLSQPSKSTPPPPPPPPPIIDIQSHYSTPSNHSSSMSDKTQLFNSINQGETITQGLKKVDRSTEAATTTTTTATPKDGERQSRESLTHIGSLEKKPTIGGNASPPMKQLDGNKWRLENLQNDPSVIVSDTELKQVVYIYNCHHCTVQIQGKINAAVIDGCSKLGILCDSVLSSIEVIRSQDIQLQVTDYAPTMMLDKVDGAQIYYSKKCKDEGTQLLTAKCSEINILTPSEEEEGFIENPVPQQFKTYFDQSGNLVTQTVFYTAC